MATTETTTVTGYAPAPAKMRAETLSEFCYNSETGEVLGRTGLGWLKLLVFYIIFYACLAGFFLGMIQCFQVDIDDTRPKYFNEGGLMMNAARASANPGLGFRPFPSFDTTLIFFNSGVEGSYEIYQSELAEFLKAYEMPESELKPCGENNVLGEEACLVKNMKQNVEKVCGVDYSESFAKGDACVFLKVNKIFGWKPIPYNCKDKATCKKQGMFESDYDFLEKEFLRIAEDSDGNSFSMDTLFNGKSIVLTCEGINEADKSNLQRIVYPTEGPIIQSFYYPYLNQKDYHSPILPVRITATKGVLLMVSCKAWAQNIDFQDFLSRDGAVHFEILSQ